MVALSGCALSPSLTRSWCLPPSLTHINLLFKRIFQLGSNLLGLSGLSSSGLFLEHSQRASREGT